ncbi:MAG TPA: hypothetical protein VGM90_22370 [Kofleriaceae bacterium]|jgi:hypothetical protein
MSQSVGGGLSATELFDEEELDVDSVIGPMTGARTVSHFSRSPEGSAEIAIGNPTVKLAPATRQIKSDNPGALGVVIAGEKQQPVREVAPPQLSRSTWSEHPPAVSIAVDRSYESSLAAKKLTVTHEGEDEGVTTPIQVVHEQMLAQLTMPIPRSNLPAMLHAIAVAAPVTKKAVAWKGVAFGLAVALASVVAAMIALT